MVRPLRERDLWLVDHLVVPAALYDTDGRCVRISAAAELASGVSNAQMVGRYVNDLVPPESRAHVEEQFRRAVDGEPTDFETDFVDAGGHRRFTRAQHLPLREGDGIAGVLILAFEGRRPAESELIALRPRPELTPRQQEILELIAAGRSTSEIASELTLSSETVRNHLRNLFRVLHAHTRVEARATAHPPRPPPPPLPGPPHPHRRYPPSTTL